MNMPAFFIRHVAISLNGIVIPRLDTDFRKENKNY